MQKFGGLLIGKRIGSMVGRPLVIVMAALSMICASPALAQDGRDKGDPRNDDFLEKLIWEHASPRLKRILDRPDSFRYQILYTRIDRDRHNQPSFHHYYYRVNRLEYFNPASTVKLPLALLALEKMNGLAGHGIDKFTPMLTDSGYSAQGIAHTDSSAATGLPSLAQYIKKIFLVSDNDAYNRLYEFLGQSSINERLWQMGYEDIRITRRFVPMDVSEQSEAYERAPEGVQGRSSENRHTNPIRFVKEGKLLYAQPPAASSISFDFSRKILIGNGHLDRNDKLIPEPMDFTRHNNVPLEDLQKILQSALFPNSVAPAQRFNLGQEDYRFLYRYMSQYPSEETHPRYDTAVYFDSYAKFMFKAGRTQIPPYIRIFNKPGWSYGFLTDIAYVADFKNKVEFMISAVIYVNSDGILNDDKYEYEEIGYPFFKELGDILYGYELTRKRRYSPDLKEFGCSYGPGPF